MLVCVMGCLARFGGGGQSGRNVEIYNENKSKRSAIVFSMLLTSFSHLITKKWKVYIFTFFFLQTLFYKHFDFINNFSKDLLLFPLFFCSFSIVNEHPVCHRSVSRQHTTASSTNEPICSITRGSFCFPEAKVPLIPSAARCSAQLLNGCKLIKLNVIAIRNRTRIYIENAARTQREYCALFCKWHCFNAKLRVVKEVQFSLLHCVPLIIEETLLCGFLYKLSKCNCYYKLQNVIANNISIK